MRLELLMKGETGLSDKDVKMLMDYARYRKEQTRKNAPLGDSWATVRPLIGTFPQDFLPDREQPTWDAVPDREEM